MNAMTELAGVTNGGEAVIDLSQPYRVSFELTGTSDMLMHRWNNEAVDEKAKAAKNSKAKKSDDIESYVYRNDDGMVCLPGEYVRQAIIFAAKFRQDPRSPRKSAMDLYKAGVVSLTDLASLGRDTWDYEDRRRVVVQRAGINRTRPAFKKGWRAEFDFIVLTPEYIEPTDLHAVLTQAGILIGGPTYGRFGVTKYQVITD
ncbi:hypothetical protein [Burkholderia pseudomallei]|uniref:hypothetical protein n=1 Tax=Burkholderia pseudomallei TaxID=28450 RepID=UPI000F2679EB|nr:hypothetical protein [Burkholderia pseudomallei]VBM94870.1 Uncharacterised protein [Burkholderia pseudomallei]